MFIRLRAKKLFTGCLTRVGHLLIVGLSLRSSFPTNKTCSGWGPVHPLKVTGGKGCWTCSRPPSKPPSSVTGSIGGDSLALSVGDWSVTLRCWETRGQRNRTPLEPARWMKQTGNESPQFLDLRREISEETKVLSDERGAGEHDDSEECRAVWR